MTKVTVVLAVHNRCKLTERFLETILSQSFTDYQTVVVDDGSTDGTYEMISQKFPSVHLIKGDGNLWWTKATNIGVRYAIDQLHTEYICTMNDDTEVDYHFIEEIYNAAKNNAKSIVGCFSYDITNREKLLYDGSIINWLTGRITTVNSDRKAYSGQELIPVTYYVGRGVIIPAEVFGECGYYDEKNFPQSWADNDLIFRANAKGYKIFSSRKALQYIYPDESKHIKLKKRKSINNFINYLFKNQGGGNIILFSKYVVKNYPWYGVPTSLIGGILRRSLGYWKFA